jgi:hypothetical protein
MFANKMKIMEKYETLLREESKSCDGGISLAAVTGKTGWLFL